MSKVRDLLVVVELLLLIGSRLSQQTTALLSDVAITTPRSDATNSTSPRSESNSTAENSTAGTLPFLDKPASTPSPLTFQNSSTIVTSLASNSSTTTPPRDMVPIYALPRVVRNLGWVIALITLASAGIVAVLAIEVWLLIKTLAVPSSPGFQSMWLGQVLLFAIFCSYLTLFAFLPFSSSVTCGIIRFCVGVCYALCFSVLVVKLLLILDSRSQQVHDVSTRFQVTLLFFVWAVQVTVDIQWLITSPPKTTLFAQANEDSNPWGFCDPGFAAHVQSLVYVMFLILVCVILALGTHGNRANHREGMFIGIAAGMTVATWIVWILLGFLMNDPFWHEPCIAFGLLATVTWILLVMFVPKLYHLHKMSVAGPMPELYSPGGVYPRSVFEPFHGTPETLSPESRRARSAREEESLSRSMRFGDEAPPNGNNPPTSGTRQNNHSHNNPHALYLRHPGGPVTYGIKLPGFHPPMATSADDVFQEPSAAKIFAANSQPLRLSTVTKDTSQGQNYQHYKSRNYPSPRISSGSRHRP